MIERCHTKLETVEPRIKIALRQAGVIHQDETGVSVANTRHWLHVTATARLTHYQVHRSRGHEALEANGILPGYTGISVHDGFGSYFLYGCQHALCNVHLLRDLTFLAEEQRWWWAAKLKALLLSMKEATEQARTLGKHWLHPLEVVDWETRFLDLLAEGDAAHPRAQAPPGQRGRVKQHPARNLLDRLRKHQHAVWAFLEDLRVDFDNDYVAYCTPSAWLRCLLKLTFILVVRVFVGWWEQHDPTAISMVHGNAPSSPPIPDGLWRDSIGLSGLGGG